MFDPSKINLDLDNLDKNNLEEKTKTEAKNTDSIKNISEGKTDILNDENLIEKIENIWEDINKNKEKIENRSNIEEEFLKTNNQENKEEITWNNNQTVEKETSEEVIVKEKEQTLENKEKRIIYDININSLEYLIKYLISKQYDFFTLEPNEDNVKVSFRKDNIEKEVKYIKFPTYTNILLKAKSLTKLKIEDTTNSQEWTAEMNFNKKVYKAISKTVTSNNWEKLFFKVVETQKKQAPKKKEKMSMWKMLSIFAWLLFTAFLIWGIFITIVLFNSNSVQDLQFFNNLWVNTNLIKEFAAKLVNGIFWFILLIEIIFLFVFSYKALTIKKQYKKKKVSRIIIAIFFLIISTITLLTWIFLAQKINSLKWLNYWKIESYDNSKLLSKLFDKESSKIDIDENIIWPITIRFDIKEFIQKLIDDWFTPTKLIWEIGKDKIEKPSQNYELIYNFEKKWLNTVKLIVEWINIKWEEDKKENDIWTINLNNIVKIDEIKLDNWWSKFVFDASDLKYLWKIKWYYIPSLKGKTDNEANTIISKALSKEKLIWYIFNSKNIFEGEEYYWMKIVSDGKESEFLDKLFVVSKGSKNEISWKLEYTQDLDNENKYNFIFKNPETKIWEAYIKEYKWKIQDFDDKWNETFINLDKNAKLSDLENSSKVNYIFKKSWEHKINLTIIDSNWKEQYFNETINISKKLQLLTKLDFSINNIKLEYKKDIKYEKNNNTYYLDNIASPSILQIDARKIRPLNQKYWLENVYWDLNNDWNFEKTDKKTTFNIDTEWNHSFKVKYSFVNKNIKTDIINVIETIHITSIQKDAILNLEINKPSSYTPVVVSFDATKSQVTWKNIDKFIFDYWDWTKPEERDWKNTWHKYTKEWDYTVKLTVVTTDWKRYSIEKKLILKPKPQTAKIKTSLKKAPVYQNINFSAENSIWEVWSYFWDFGDWTTSSKMSLSHFYSKAWTYKVSLELEYTNKNIKKDEIEIEIYEE